MGTITKDEIIASKTSEVVAVSELSASQMANHLHALDKDSLDEIIASLKDDHNVNTAYVLFEDGRVFTDGTGKNPIYGKYLPNAVFEHYRISQETFHSTSDNVIYVSAPIQTTERIGTLLLTFYLDTTGILQNILINIFFSGIVAVTVIILVARISIAKIIKPLILLKNDIKKISQGDFNHKISVSGKDEIGDLSMAFEEMRQKIQDITSNLNSLVSLRTRDLQNAYDQLTIKEQQIKLHLSELQKLDVEKDKFLAMISHEMKTPLVPIQGYADILLGGHCGELSDRQKERLKIIAQSAQSLNNLISDLLDIQHISLNRLSIKKSKTDMNKLLVRSLDEVTIFFEQKKCEIETDFQKDVVCYCDDQRIKQVIINLVKNALNHSKENNKITIIMKQVKNNVRILVKDYGSGIKQENLDIIFEAFYQVDTSLTREVGGSGLGLPICRGIIKSHEGNIWAKSDGVNKGSEFFVEIPLGINNSKSIVEIE